MPFTVTMPKLSPTMEEGQIAKWHKNVGDKVEPGELLLEVATDKATIEYNALDGGYLRQLLVKEGDNAAVNQPIAIFTEQKDESIEGFLKEEPKKEAPKPQEAKPEPVKEAAPAPKTPSMTQPSTAPEKPLPFTTASPSKPSDRVMASPLAKKLAKEKGLDLTNLEGTGPGGRIMSRDLERASPAGKFSLGKKGAPTEAPGSFEEVTLTPMRKTIAQRLQEAKTFVPHFYVTQEIDAAALVNLKDQLAALDMKVSYNDLVVKACSVALREHPIINSGFNPTNNTIIKFKTIDISIAVNLPTGLITPIIRHADYKTVTEISAEIKALAARAKDGKLETHEYRGGSFTVSNLGMFGVKSFSAIINPPQGGILAVSGILDTPIVKNGQVVAGKVMSLTLSVDHRVIDGVAAAEFMQTLKKYLENPVALII